MADGWGPEEWAVAWQSAPAHLLGYGGQEPLGHAAPDRADPSQPEADPVLPAQQIRPKPIWHAIPPQRGTPSPSDSELQELGARIRGMAAQLAASTCEWLHLIERFDREGGWAGVGIASCAAWLSWTCSVSPPTAREYVRVARSLPLLPQIDAAFAAGQLSYSKVRVLITVAAEVDESVLLEQARTQTASQLERTIRAFRRGGGWRCEQGRRASWRWDDDGMLIVSARLPPDEGALLIAALEQSRENSGSEEAASLGRDSQSQQQAALTRADSRDVARANMLVGLAQRALAAGETDSSGDDRHLVMVHVDLAELEGESDETGKRGHIEHGPGLEPQVLRRMVCDASLVAVLHHVGAGEPLRLGRKTRTISPAQRRALRVRDGGCQFPGCSRLTHLNAHHVQPWSLFGRTDLENLVLLCRFHHMLVHEGGFSVSAGSASTWIFRDPRGDTVVPSPPLGGGDSRSLLTVAIDGSGLFPEWRGEPFHLAETVGALAMSPRGGT